MKTEEKIEKIQEIVEENPEIVKTLNETEKIVVDAVRG